MDEKFLQQLFAELIEAQGQALGLIVGAIARQVDAGKLTQDLRAALSAAEAAGTPTMAVHLATPALAAAEAEALHQRMPRRQ